MAEHPSISGMGLTNFVWWTGTVEDRKDPFQLGRVRVRIHGWHTKNKDTANTPYDAMASTDLPWALVTLPTTSAGMHGIGDSMNNLVEGTQVIGFFLDGTSGGQPVVFGVIPGVIESVKTSNITDAIYDAKGSTRIEGEGFFDPRTADELVVAPRPPLQVMPLIESATACHYPHDSTAAFQSRFGTTVGMPDTHNLARGVSSGTPIEQRLKTRRGQITLPQDFSIVSGELFGDIVISEPAVAYAAKYPYNKVSESESGHVHEVDDTPGAERIHTWHRSGTFTQMNPDGSRTTRVTKNDFHRTMGDKLELIEGNYYIANKGNYRLNCPGATIDIADGVMTVSADTVTCSVTNDLNLEAGGEVNITGLKGVNVTSPTQVVVSAPMYQTNASGMTFAPFPGTPPVIVAMVSAPITLGLMGVSLTSATPLPTAVAMTCEVPITTAYAAPVSNTYTQLTETATEKSSTIGTESNTVGNLSNTVDNQSDTIGVLTTTAETGTIIVGGNQISHYHTPGSTIDGGAYPAIQTV